MSKRDEARQESAFLRGDVGVDGRATEEERDPAEVEREKAREQFLRGKAWLGREFLTWILWRSESSEPVATVDGAPLSVVLTSRLVLRGIAGEIVETTVRGAMAPYSPLVRRSLDRGLLVHAARLRLAHGERTFEVNVDADHFDLKSGKLPELLSEEDDDRLQERLQLAELLARLFEELLATFLRLRASKRWAKEIVPEMKSWMRAPAEKKRAAG